MRYLIFVFLLIGCKDLPQTEKKETIETAKKPDPSPSVKPEKLLNIKCQDDVFFLDVVAAEYSIKEKKKGKDVTCTLITNSGLKVSHTEIYPNGEDAAFEYFSFCKISHGGYWIHFAIPGFYDVGKKALLPTDAGWKILNITNLAGSPADGYAFDKGTCKDE